MRTQGHPEEREGGLSKPESTRAHHEPLQLAGMTQAEKHITYTDARNLALGRRRVAKR